MSEHGEVDFEVDDIAQTDNATGGWPSDSQQASSDNRGGNNELFVARFSTDVTEAEVNAFFSSYGRVKDVQMRVDSIKNSAFSFVTFEFEDDAAAAKHALHRTPGLGSQSIIVDFKKPHPIGGARKEFRRFDDRPSGGQQYPRRDNDFGPPSQSRGEYRSGGRGGGGDFYPNPRSEYPPNPSMRRDNYPPRRESGFEPRRDDYGSSRPAAQFSDYRSSAPRREFPPRREEYPPAHRAEYGAAASRRDDYGAPRRNDYVPPPPPPRRDEYAAPAARRPAASYDAERPSYRGGGDPYDRPPAARIVAPLRDERAPVPTAKRGRDDDFEDARPRRDAPHGRDGY